MTKLFARFHLARLALEYSQLRLAWFRLRHDLGVTEFTPVIPPALRSLERRMIQNRRTVSSIRDLMAG